MTTNFDEIINRRGTNSYKWDSAADGDVLPLWVADMDFRTAPAITQALQQRVAHGIFGYVKVPESYYEATISWFARRHSWQIHREDILYTSGVVPAISAIIKAMTSPGDKVLVQTPVYNCFFSSIRNNGCEMVSNKLLYHDQTYTIDFEDLERKAADERVKVMLLCNPHNPAGRAWTADELKKIGEICLKHDVFIISDEIHGELVYPGHTYTPLASLSDELLTHSATCVSPSKAFNIAGLQIANIVAGDAEVKRKIDKAINVNEVCDVNPFGVEALQAAYNEGEAWLDSLLVYLKGNYDYLKAYFDEHLPQFPVVNLEATYLVWIDCSTLHQTSTAISEELLREAKVWLNDGEMYGETDTPFVRINIACPRARLQQALDRIARVWNKSH